MDKSEQGLDATSLRRKWSIYTLPKINYLCAMGSYTKIDLPRAAEILSLYDLGRVDEIAPLSLGISNSNYRVVTSTGEWLLKVSNDKNQEQLKQEQNILLYLKENNYPFSLSPMPLKDQSGYIYQSGAEFGVVFPFIKGIPPGPGDSTCFAIGKALAQLHLVPVDGSLRSHEVVGFGPKQILDYSMSDNCPTDFKESFNLMLKNQISNFFDSNPRKSLIHGDLYYDNTLFHNDELAVVLDFEQSGIGESLLDVGISISGTCLEKSFISTELIRSFLKGYESLCPLTKEEKGFIFDSIILGLFSIALWRIKRFKEGGLDPSMSDSYQELLNKARVFFQKGNLNGQL